MAVLNPDHLLEQATRLLAPPPAGPPRQVDLRRAISSAYYAVFHFALTRAADEIVGKTKRATNLYPLVYRSVDHRAFKELCLEARKTTPATKYVRFVPPNGFGKNIQAFATAVVDLQERRHTADYDPSMLVRTSDATLAVQTAKSAMVRFDKASQPRKKAFLTLMLFAPR